MTKRRLKELDEHLKEWDNMLDKNAIRVGAYDKTINRLRQERAELVGKIGRKKCQSSSKR
jgi:hypothetical protein